MPMDGKKKRGEEGNRRSVSDVEKRKKKEKKEGMSPMDSVTQLWTDG